MPAFEQLQRASNRESYTLFSPSTQFKASTSRYGNKKQTVSTTKFRAPRDGSLFFGDAAAPDPAERARLAEQLDADVAALDGARADMETAKAAMHDADAAVAELRSRKVAATGQASATAKARARVAELEQRARAAAQAAEPARVQREQSVVRADIDKLLDRLAAKATELARAHAAHADEAIELQCAALGARCAAEAVAEVTERAAAAKEALDAAARAEEMARKSKADAEARVVAAVNAATALAPDFAAANPKGFALSGEAKETWEAMPDNDDAIADELEHVNRKLSTSTADASALRRFEANAKAIDDLQRALEAFESEAQGQAHELARRRAAWEPKVRRRSRRSRAASPRRHDALARLTRHAAAAACARAPPRRCARWPSTSPPSFPSSSPRSTAWARWCCMRPQRWRSTRCRSASSGGRPRSCTRSRMAGGTLVASAASRRWST